MSTPAAEVAPCAECGTTRGYVDPRCQSPGRFSGSRFGLEGKLCHGCYNRRSKRRPGSKPRTAARAKPFRVDPLEHQGLIHLVARKFRGRGMDDMDLIGWAQVGLVKACQGFKPDLKIQFSTYAAEVIRRTLIREINDKVPMVRLPEYLRKTLGGVKSGQPINPDNLADARATIDRKVHREDALACPLADLAVARPEDDTAEDREQARAQAHAILSGLPEREATVLRLRFGIDEEEPWTLIEIGKSLGLTRERARQIEAIAMARVRRQMEVSA